MVNTIKVLEKKGYDTYQCMGVLESMKPLKFPIFVWGGAPPTQ